ncbi:DPYS.2 family protein [Megaselia abdita]
MSEKNKVYIKGGQVVNCDKILNADVYIEDGLIKFVGSPADFKIPEGARIIDAKGKFVMPGGIDPHTHFEVLFQGEISPDDFYIGTKASVAGGTTTIIDFVLPKTGESLVEKYHHYRKVADEKVCCDYSLHICLSWWSKAVSDEIEVLARDHGVNSFKMFMAYKGFCQLRDWEMYEALEKIRAVKGLAMVHAENGDIIERNVEQLLKNGITGPEGHQLSRQEEVEAEAVHRACILAHQANCPLPSLAAKQLLMRSRKLESATTEKVEFMRKLWQQELQ